MGERSFGDAEWECGIKRKSKASVWPKNACWWKIGFDPGSQRVESRGKDEGISSQEKRRYQRAAYKEVKKVKHSKRGSKIKITWSYFRKESRTALKQINEQMKSMIHHLSVKSCR